jgi:hypothetical protein
MKTYTVEVDDDGTKHWYLNGKCHREDGPAIEFVNESKYWFLNGKCHREDGPAMVYSNGDKSWWIDGKKLTEAEFNSRSKIITIDGITYKLVKV